MKFIKIENLIWNYKNLSFLKDFKRTNAYVTIKIYNLNPLFGSYFYLSWNLIFHFKEITSKMWKDIPIFSIEIDINIIKPERHNYII